MGERPEAIFLPTIIIGTAAFCKMNFSFLLRLSLIDIPSWCLIKLGLAHTSLLHVFLKKNNFRVKIQFSQKGISGLRLGKAFLKQMWLYLIFPSLYKELKKIALSQ